MSSEGPYSRYGAGGGGPGYGGGGGYGGGAAPGYGGQSYGGQSGKWLHYCLSTPRLFIQILSISLIAR
eukprot:CCRYP_004693-RA/>CCRYP_004693-RA protein AED:0.46 eAED:0.46 QI:299/1/0.5/1/1/1/2/0/67